jgi:hypothetical protein
MDGDGILCPHLVALGIHAAKDLGTLADYVIPLSLAESSPSETLVKLGLIEGSTEGRFRPTRLGRVVNRLYLGIPTVRELLALLPLTGDSVGLLWLLKHLVSLETNTALGENFEHLIAAAATTDVPLKELARSTGHNVGDVVGLIETSRWLLYSIAAVSEVGGLQSVLTIARNLLDRLEKRLVVSHDRSDGVEY